SGIIGAMRGDECEPRRLIAVGERQAGLGGATERRGDAGHYDGGNVRLAQSLELLAAAAKDERIPAFEAPDSAAAARRLDQAAVDLLLADAGQSLALADEHALSVATRPVEHSLTDQIVIEHDVRALQRLQSAQR